MDKYCTLFDPSFIGYSPQSILDLCEEFDRDSIWEDIYKGVRLDCIRGSVDFLRSDASLIIASFNPDLNITVDDTQLFRMRAGQKGVLHKDTDRQCGILFPMTPVGDEFAPIMFFDEDRTKIKDVNYSRDAIIVNVLEFHDVALTDTDRINFQVNFDVPYHTVVEMLNDGKLFKDRKLL